MKLADKILLLRKKQGMSQETLAEKLNVSRQAVSRWEMGTAQPDAANLLQLSKLFAVSADFLLNDEYAAEDATPDMQPAMPTKNETAKTIPLAGETILTAEQPISSSNGKIRKIIGLCTTTAGLLGNFIIYCISRMVKVMIPIESISPTGEIWYSWSSAHTGYSYKYFIQEHHLEFLTILFWLFVIAGLLIAFVKIKKK